MVAETLLGFPSKLPAEAEILGHLFVLVVTHHLTFLEKNWSLNVRNIKTSGGSSWRHSNALIFYS